MGGSVIGDDLGEIEMQKRHIITLGLAAVSFASPIGATELDLQSESRELIAVQKDLLAFQEATPKSTDSRLAEALAYAVQHAQTVLAHVRDLVAILEHYDCDREALGERIDSIVTTEVLPGLRLDLEDVNLQLNHMTDPVAKDAGIRARTTLRASIQALEERWAADP